MQTVGQLLLRLYCSSATLRLLRALAFQPTQIRYLRSWINTYHSNALSDEQPWITFSARSWLESALRPEMRVFEYGSGGSTLYFASRVARVVSVEHDANWYDRTRTELEKKDLRNVEYLLRVPDNDRVAGTSCEPAEYISARYKCRQASFRKYVETIDDYPDESFDLVFIDGRCRNACAKHAISKVRRNGLVVLDNCERTDYAPIWQLLSSFKRREFSGLCPYGNWFWKTAAWAIDDDVTLSRDQQAQLGSRSDLQRPVGPVTMRLHT